MTNPSARRVALRHLGVQGRTASRVKTAGEVRFIKDRGGDKNEWGWGSPGPSERQITNDFVFNAKYLKPLACTMRSALMALGHATSAHSRFVKIKSRNISPDGSLGGQGYIAKIPDMRRQLMNVIEALSAFTDTVYDEIEAPHWDKAEDTLTPRDRADVKDIVEDVREIKEDPEGWARDEEKEMDDIANESMKMARSKTASRDRVYLDKDDITGDWAVYVIEGRRHINVTDHIYRNEWAAYKEAEAIREQVAAGMSAQQIGKARFATWNGGHDCLVVDVTYRELDAMGAKGFFLRKEAHKQDASVLSHKGKWQNSDEYAGTFVMAADNRGGMYVDFVPRRPDAGRVALRYLETP